MYAENEEGGLVFPKDAHYSHFGTCCHTVLMPRAAPSPPLTTKAQRGPHDGLYGIASGTLSLFSRPIPWSGLQKYQLVLLHVGYSWERYFPVVSLLQFN